MDFFDAIFPHNFVLLNYFLTASIFLISISPFTILQLSVLLFKNIQKYE